MMTGRVRGAATLAGALVMVLAGCAPATDDGAPSSTASDEAATGPSAPAARLARSAHRAEPPIAATLPSGVVVPIQSVSTTRDGRLDVPADTGRAGWWRGGARLGDPFGSILVAAHVDSRTRGLGPFAELLGLGRGDRVVLASAHLTQRFVVDSLRLVPQGPLTEERSLFGVTGSHRLTLVTCAPPYDRDRGGYQNLAVVTAVPSSPLSRDRP